MRHRTRARAYTLTQIHSHAHRHNQKEHDKHKSAPKNEYRAPASRSRSTGTYTGEAGSGRGRNTDKTSSQRKRQRPEHSRPPPARTNTAPDGVPTSQLWVRPSSIAKPLTQHPTLLLPSSFLSPNPSPAQLQQSSCPSTCAHELGMRQSAPVAAPSSHSIPVCDGLDVGVLICRSFAGVRPEFAPLWRSGAYMHKHTGACMSASKAGEHMQWPRRSKHVGTHKIRRPLRVHVVERRQLAPILIPRIVVVFCVF